MEVNLARYITRCMHSATARWLFVAGATVLFVACDKSCLTESTPERALLAHYIRGEFGESVVYFRSNLPASELATIRSKKIDGKWVLDPPDVNWMDNNDPATKVLVELRRISGTKLEYDVSVFYSPKNGRVEKVRLKYCGNGWKILDIERLSTT